MASAKVFLGGMMMAMMLILIPVILQFVFAADVSDTLASIEESEERFVVLEGIRRIGVAIYVLAIAFGLATIIKVPTRRGGPFNNGGGNAGNVVMTTCRGTGDRHRLVRWQGRGKASQPKGDSERERI